MNLQTFVDVELCDVDAQVDVVDLLLLDEGDPSDEVRLIDNVEVDDAKGWLKEMRVCFF